MKVGYVGLGKLGMPCAVAVALRGHDVMGYDIRSDLMTKAPRPYLETGPNGKEPFDPYLRESTIRFGELDEMSNHADLIFVAVQTPHESAFEGASRLPSQRRDFDYTKLVDAMRQISASVKRETIITIISTVLPGTIRRYVRPLLNPHIKICYNPFFIAMGTTMRDFLNPEFVLLGSDDESAADRVENFYRTLVNAPVRRMSIESAELTKVAYNTFIGMKIVFANTIMEISHKTPGANADSVMGALKCANRRLISSSYLNGGMGDGGGCHPRDNIAMSWLARELPLSHNIFDNLMMARESQTEWLADLMCAYDLPKAIVGYAFKRKTNLTVGSAALLLKEVLAERGINPMLYDPYVEGEERDLSKLAPHVFLIGTDHPDFVSSDFPKGSVIIDPWRYLPEQPDGVKLVSVGLGPPT